MDTDHFDHLAHIMIDTCSRRRGLAALLGGPLGLLGLAETAAKTGKGKRKNRKKRKKSRGNPPPAATCGDGITNGSESDVDCGGTCPRCANSKSCATRNDCAGALCSGGTCQACTTECGFDGNGECYCVTPETGPPRVCVTGYSTPDDYVQSCTACPTGTIYCSGPSGPAADRYLCYMPCGAA